MSRELSEAELELDDRVVVESDPVHVRLVRAQRLGVDVENPLLVR